MGDRTAMARASRLGYKQHLARQLLRVLPSTHTCDETPHDSPVGPALLAIVKSSSTEIAGESSGFLPLRFGNPGDIDTSNGHGGYFEWVYEEFFCRGTTKMDAESRIGANIVACWVTEMDI